MFQKILFFLKYNNVFILILAIIFIIGSGAFAASEPGQEFIGKKETQVVGTDNTLLLEADLENFDMDFKIEKIEEDQPTPEAAAGKPDDDGYYYVKYTYLDLIKKDNAWQYQLNEKNRKISKSLKKDLGVYLAEELKEEYEARIRDLKSAKAEAKTQGKSVRQETVAYSGLIGKSLEISAKLFDGYEPVKKIALPSPTVPPTMLVLDISGEDSEETGTDAEKTSPADNLSFVYSEYMTRMDPDKDGYAGDFDNCPDTANADQADIDQDGIGDVCEVDTQAATGSAEQATGSVELIAEDEESATADLQQEESTDAMDTPDSQPISEDYETVEVVEIK